MITRPLIENVYKKSLRLYHQIQKGDIPCSQATTMMYILIKHCDCDDADETLEKWDSEFKMYRHKDWPVKKLNQCLPRDSKDAYNAYNRNFPRLDPKYEAKKSYHLDKINLKYLQSHPKKCILFIPRAVDDCGFLNFVWNCSFSLRRILRYIEFCINGELKIIETEEDDETESKLPYAFFRLNHADIPTPNDSLFTRAILQKLNDMLMDDKWFFHVRWSSRGQLLTKLRFEANIDGAHIPRKTFDKIFAKLVKTGRIKITKREQSDRDNIEDYLQWLLY